MPISFENENPSRLQEKRNSPYDNDSYPDFKNFMESDDDEKPEIQTKQKNKTKNKNERLRAKSVIGKAWHRTRISQGHFLANTFSNEDDDEEQTGSSTLESDDVQPKERTSAQYSRSTSPTNNNKTVKLFPLEAIDSSGNVHLKNENPPPPVETPISSPNDESITFQFQPSNEKDSGQQQTAGGVLAAESHDSWVTVPFDNDKLELEERNAIVFKPLIVPQQEKSPRSKNVLNLGNPTEEWLSNIEKLFIHFFIVMFDTESDSSKVMLEMFPLENSKRIEGTFRILYKMDSDLYKDLEHVVYLAQNWIVSRAIKGPGQQKALKIINDYKFGVNAEDNGLLSTEMRLNNLKTFIQSLETIGDLPKRQISEHNRFKRDTYGAEENEPVVINRPKSPRVKPGSHYARVVANILCDRPCGRPVTPPDVYADKFVKKFLKSQFITEKELQEYTDNIYGKKYRKTDIFHQINPNLYRKKLNPSHIDPLNRNCMLPIYSSGYLKKVKDGTCCPRRPKRKSSATDHADGFTSPRGHYHRYKVLSDSSEEWEHDFNTGRRTKRKAGYTRGPYGGYVVGVKNYYEQKVKTKTHGEAEGDRWDRRNSDRKGIESGRPRHRYDSEPDPEFYSDNRRKGGKRDKYSSRKPRRVGSETSGKWEKNPQGRRPKKLPSKGKKYTRLRHIESDPDSELFEHDAKGRRTVRKPGPLGDYYQFSSQPLRNIDSDPNSEGWEHDRHGRRIARKTRSRRTKRRQRNIESDSNSDNWEHNKTGKRTKRKPDKTGKLRNIDSDPNSVGWEHDKTGKRTKRKPDNAVKLRNIDSDPNSEGWEHDKSGKRLKRKPKEKIDTYSHRKLRNIDSDSDSDAWEHNKDGKRTKRKPNVDKYSYIGHKPHKKKGGNSQSDSDSWEYDKKGYRTIKNPNSSRRMTHVPQPKEHKHFDYPKHREHRMKGIKSDSDSDAWNHDKHGKRTKRKANYAPRKSIASDSDSDAWIHDEKGKRVKRIPGYKPRKSIASDSDSDAWEHNRRGRRIKRVAGYIPRKGINSDPDSDNWLHDSDGKRTERVPMHNMKLHGRSKRKDKSGKKLDGLFNTNDKRKRQQLEVEDKNGKKDDKLPHLGDGDQLKGIPKTGKNKSMIAVTLPPLAKKKYAFGQPEDVVQINYRAKEQQKPKKPRDDRRNTKYVTESLFRGYAMNSDSDDSFDGNLNFIPKFYDDDQDAGPSPPHEEGDEEITEIDEIGINTCWELSEILFKSPYNKTLIPAPENILGYIKHTLPRSRWAQGPPIATRKYPNGALFCSMYANGSSLVFYPHGGLAIAISAARPFHRVLVIRDPLDGFFFMDKAILAQLHTVGHGSVYDQNGTVHSQYNSVGGFQMEKGVDQPSRRWLWNEGGIRLILKLNKYMRLHVSKLDKIGLAFNGNKRGLFLNVGAGRKVAVLRVEQKEELIGPKGKPKLKNPESLVPPSTKSRSSRNDTALSLTSQGDMAAMNDYLDGKYSSPLLGFVDKENEEA